MLPIIALLLCAINITTAHLMSLQYDEYVVVFQAYIALLCLGAVVSDGSQRDKSILTVLLIWEVWILTTDQFNIGLPDVVLSLESAFFTSFVLWAIARPHFYPSDQRSELNVCIAFYKGSHAPLISSIGALFGLPFASVAIVAGATVLRPSGSGKMTITNGMALHKDDFVFVDTGIECTPEIIKQIALCSGKPTTVLGIFRVKCVANIMPVLRLMKGYEPKNWLYRIPSIFYYQCVRQAHG